MTLHLEVLSFLIVGDRRYACFDLHDISPRGVRSHVVSFANLLHYFVRLLPWIDLLFLKVHVQCCTFCSLTANAVNTFLTNFCLNKQALSQSFNTLDDETVLKLSIRTRARKP